MAVRSERTLRELLRVIASRFLGMVVVFLLVVAAAVVVTWRAPKWYQSEVQLRAKSSGQIGSPLGTQGALKDEVVLYISTLRSLISSDHVLGSALLRLRNDSTKDSDRPAVKRPVLPGSDGQDGGDLTQWLQDVKDWEVEVNKYVSANADKVAELRKRLSVVTPGGPDATFTEILKVQILWPEEPEVAEELAIGPQKLAAERAMTLAKYVVEAYTQRYAELEYKRSDAEEKFLASKSLAAAKNDLDAATDALTKFIETKAKAYYQDMVLMSGKGSSHGTGTASLAHSYRMKITDLDEQIAALTSTLEALQAELKKVDEEKIAIPSKISTNPAIHTLKTKMLTLKLHINSLKPRYTADYKELATAEKELASSKAELRTELTNQVGAIKQEIASKTASLGTFQTKLTKAENHLMVLEAYYPTWKRLTEAEQAAQVRYDKEKDTVGDAITARELSNSAIQLTVLGEPSQADPTKPAKPIMFVNVILAVVGGFILALIYAFSADHFDHTFKGVDDAERYLGVPVLASIPKLGRRMIRAKRGA